MVSRKQLDAQLDALHALRNEPDTEAARAELARALQSRTSAVVAVAANIVATAELRGLHAALIGAFERFMLEPEKTDKACTAKTAIVRALYRTEADCDALFLRGVRHVQLEPVWGGKQDTAVELRATAALALVQSDYPQVMLELARLLADPEAQARAGAAQALGATRHADAAAPLLRYKALAGDSDPRVTGACLSSLLARDPEESLAFVAELLSAREAGLRESAAVALGESRQPGALAPLREACERAHLPEELKAPMLGLALLRLDAAWGYLLDQVRDAPDACARQALEALSVFRHDQELRARALDAVTSRDQALARFARQVFDT